MDTYRRRISTEEEREGYILVEKRALAMFPPVGEEFALGGRPTRIRATTCTCSTADAPHEHHVIDRDGVRRGQEVVITRLDDGEYGYR